MLSRTAANLFWMSRYIERAESTVRLLEACSNQPGAQAGNLNIMRIPLKATSSLETFEAQGHSWKWESIHNFLVFDTSHPNSIMSCLKQARMNAKPIRANLSSPVYEAINIIWLEMLEKSKESGGSRQDFYDWMRRSSYYYFGTVQNALPRNEARRFLKLGTLLERSDQTLRIIMAHHELQVTGEYSDFYHWQLLLEMVSVLEIHRGSFKEAPQKENIVQMLLFHQNVPRSLRYCLDRVCGTLEELRTTPAGKVPSKEAALLFAKIKYDTIQEVKDHGLEDYIGSIIADLNKITHAISTTYLGTL